MTVDTRTRHVTARPDGSTIIEVDRCVTFRCDAPTFRCDVPAVGIRNLMPFCAEHYEPVPGVLWDHIDPYRLADRLTRWIADAQAEATS